MTVSWLLCVLAIPASGPADASVARLSLSPTGAKAAFGRLRPALTTLSATPPTHVSKQPQAEALLWGQIPWGPADHLTRIAVAISNADSDQPAIYVDANGDGDLTNDPDVAWPTVQPGATAVPILCRLTTVPIPGSKNPEDQLTLYRFDPAEATARNIPGNVLLYTTDRCLLGQATIGGKLRNAFLIDLAATGDFTFPAGRSKQLVVAVDADGDGKLNRAEATPAGRPFKFAGRWLKVKTISPDGTAIEFDQAQAPIVRRSGPPRPGDDAPAFTGPGLDGKPVKFPDDYKGKIVLIDFWAMWCGPCVAEIPNVVKVYKKFHDKGLEVLGISFDEAGRAARLKDFTARRQMTWRQIYEGKRFQSAVGRQWAIRGIPAMFLVDADTGKILAAGGALRGRALRPQVAKAIADKFNDK